MELKLCICDDQENEVKELSRLTTLFSKKYSNMPLHMEVFQSAYALLEYIDQHGGFDLYLLDVLMPELNGIELAKYIRRRGENAEIVFLTSSREYAIESYSVKATNYLLKPIQKSAFDKTLIDCIQNLKPKENPSFMLKTKNGFRKIGIRELVLVENFNHNQICTLSDGTTVETSSTLSSLFEQLQVYCCFYMPHRAYIIHLNYVNGLTSSEVLLSNGKKIPVSRKVYTDLKKTLLDYTLQQSLPKV